MTRYFDSGFDSGFQKRASVVTPTFIAAPPRRRVGVELGVEFILITQMTAGVVADDEQMVLALLGLPPHDPEAGLELDLLS